MYAGVVVFCLFTTFFTTVSLRARLLKFGETTIGFLFSCELLKNFFLICNLFVFGIAILYDISFRPNIFSSSAGITSSNVFKPRMLGQQEQRVQEIYKQLTKRKKVQPTFNNFQH